MGHLTLVILFFSIQLLGCSDFNSHRDLSLKSVGNHSIELDQQTGHLAYSFAIQDDGKNGLAVLLNSRNHTVYMYDWTQGKIVKTFIVPKGGPDGIPTNVTDGVFVSPDLKKVYYAASELKKLYLLSGKSLETIYSMINGKESDSLANFYFPEIGILNPGLLLNDSIFFVTNNFSYRRVSDFTSMPTIFKFTKGVKDTRFETMVPCLAIYNVADWGRTLAYMVYHSFNADSTAIISSFAKSDSLIITDIKTNSRTFVPAGSQFFSTSKVSAFANDHTIESSSFEEGVQYDFTHPCYFHIQYDPVSERYYRMTQYDFPDKETIARNKGEKRLGISFSLIVLDKDFKKLGEVTLPKNEKYNMNYVFARDGFIYIAPLPKYQPYEDSLQFEKFVIE
jgi:hypothetical protein